MKELRMIESFLEFAESLKLVRNDYIEKDGVPIIDNIYTDLLPNDGILNKVNLPRTTVLVGRKGTGKSTIFQKSQKEVEKNKKNIAIYIDIKSLYDNSTSTFPYDFQNKTEAEEIVKYLIYTNLIKDIILKIKSKLINKIEKNYILNILKLSEYNYNEVFNNLEEIEDTTENVFKTINNSFSISYKNSLETLKDKNVNTDININTKKGISGEVKISNTCHENLKKEFDNHLITYLDLKKTFIDNLVNIRNILNIKHLYLYLDDFSEIDKDAQKLFVDWFIAPVNNLSEDFVKFKIAIYPKRFYYGKVDIGKIDEISLDFFDTFSTIEKKNNYPDISNMERLALDYTKRLLNNRFNIYFPQNSWENLFDINPNDLYEMLFISTMNNPRKMGYILSYCYESHLIHDRKISELAIKDAAVRYYLEIIEKYFLVNEFTIKPFDDKISNDHQYNLFLKIIESQLKNKKHLFERESKDTSHFFINDDLIYLLDNLELNGFITTYNKLKDENNIFLTVYSLDYGLCNKYSLMYGMPGELKNNSHNLTNIFNFNSIIIDYFNSTQVIRCEYGHEFSYSELQQFKRYNMNCPDCLKSNTISICSVKMIFEDISKELIEQDKVNLTFSEYVVLNSLKISQVSTSYNKLSSRLDLSLKTISNIAMNLITKGYCDTDIEVSETFDKDFIKITPKGVKVTEKLDEKINNLKKEKFSFNMH